jgi:hypothetical protein
MRKALFVCMLTCIAKIAVCQVRPTIPPGKVQLKVRVLPEQAFKNASAEFYQQKIQDKNPFLDAWLLISKSNGALQVMVTDTTGRKLFQQPVRSEEVFLAPHHHLMAITGKTSREGFITEDGKIQIRNLEVWSTSGERLFVLNNTGIINEVHFTSQGQLLLYDERGITLYDRQGKTIWNKKVENGTITTLPDGLHFSFDVFTFKTGEHNLALYAALQGKQLGNWKYRSEESLRIMHVDQLTSTAFLSRISGTSGKPAWVLQAFDYTRGRQMKEITIPEGRPDFVSFNKTDQLARFVIQKPSGKGWSAPGDLLFASWSLQTGAMNTSILGKHQIDPDLDFFVQPAGKKEYQVHTRKNALQITY